MKKYENCINCEKALTRDDIINKTVKWCKISVCKKCWYYNHRLFTKKKENAQDNI